MKTAERKILEQAAELAINEIARSNRLWGDFHSLHEAYATLLEEVEEFWEIVKMKPQDRSIDELNEELIQIAAMALKTYQHINNRK